MTTPLHLVLGWAEWLQLFGQFLLLSLMSVGGAISTTPEIHRFLVEQHHWLTQAQFNESIAIAQAAPGPNVLFIALMGWNVGQNAGSTVASCLGVGVTMAGILLPSSLITYFAAQWGQRNRDLRAVRAFKQGMAPVVVGLLISTGMILAGANHTQTTAWPLIALSLFSGVVIWRTKIHLLWLLALGALLGWFQLV